MNLYHNYSFIIRYSLPSTQLFVLGSLISLFSAIIYTLKRLLLKYSGTLFCNGESFDNLIKTFGKSAALLLLIGVILIITSIILYLTMSDAQRIKYMIRKSLFAYECGNPLHFKDGEQLPRIRCKQVDTGLYELTISALTSTTEEIQKISTSISSALNNKRFGQYAVTQTDTDIAFNYVRFTIENVTIHRELIISSVNDLTVGEPTKLIVQQGTYIDLTTSGSMLVAGKTRSGKTTAIISLLLQALKLGRDNFSSEVMIIDPKQAELSRLPHVYTLDEDGEARSILQAIRDFADGIVKRQRILNELSEKSGDAVHWWEAGFHCSFLFIDEYVSARTIFPKKATKENGDYCLATFDGLIKRIVTMGASAGCYVIISIAEASVEEGGLPSMLKSAMSTKILFKPTLTEGRLMWDSDKLKDFSERVYNAGDAWFSSTDGVHDKVSYVHFPILKFPAYRALGELLENYYK